MANIIVFHSVFGIKRGIVDFSEKLKELGHKVFVVNLYNGKSFDDMQEAFDFFLSIGIPEMMERSLKYTEELPHDAIYIGFSNGGASAMLLAGTKPGAMGCILLHAALSITELGIEKWPSNVPVEVHYAKEDPWKDEESLVKLTKNIEESNASFKYFEYPVNGHLFTDAEMPEYNKESTELLFHRVISFINQFEQSISVND